LVPLPLVLQLVLEEQAGRSLAAARQLQRPVVACLVLLRLQLAVDSLAEV